MTVVDHKKKRAKCNPFLYCRFGSSPYASRSGFQTAYEVKPGTWALHTGTALHTPNSDTILTQCVQPEALTLRECKFGP